MRHHSFLLHAANIIAYRYPFPLPTHAYTDSQHMSTSNSFHYMQQTSSHIDAPSPFPHMYKQSQKMAPATPDTKHTRACTHKSLEQSSAKASAQHKLTSRQDRSSCKARLSTSPCHRQGGRHVHNGLKKRRSSCKVFGLHIGLRQVIHSPMMYAEVLKEA